MINDQLIAPKSIVVVGGSNNVKKPGGKILKNITSGNFQGDIYLINPKEQQVQGVSSYQSIGDLPDVDLAILAIRAEDCPQAIEVLAGDKNTKAFIIISAGFSEVNEEGRKLEEKIVKTIDDVDGCLIGPNCIGVLNSNYHGVFTSPIPQISKAGCDFISSSGATAVFVMEAGIPLGLRFNNVFSVGNAAQVSVEDVLEHMDKTYDPALSSSIKLLYMEDVRQPQKLLHHASSLIKKGCNIAAIKAGSTEAGSKAAASHTGAIANSDIATRALFRKAGIVYCSSREELISVASVFSYKKLEGENIAIITHAGGSAVMLTDALSQGGLKVPEIKGESAEELLSYLYPGSSVSNPIDFLATGTAEQLGTIIDVCEHKFNEIDAMVVVFGSPGLFDVENVYKVLNEKLDICKKPIFPVLPSLINAQKEIKYFLSKGHVNFPDEVLLGKALTEVHHTPLPTTAIIDFPLLEIQKIEDVIEESQNGFLSLEKASQVLKGAGIDIANEEFANSSDEAINCAKKLGYPVVMKVIGSLHKSDVGGVAINITSEKEVTDHFERMIKIPGTQAILIQPMLSGIELFVGAKHEPGFGHVILCGLGGIFIEVMNDVTAGISPLNRREVKQMMKSLKGYPIIQGIRGGNGVNEEMFCDIILRVSALLDRFPEISEMDINPLLGNVNSIVAVDVRIKIDKNIRRLRAVETEIESKNE